MNINVPKINRDKLFLNKEVMLTKQIKEGLYSGKAIEIIFNQIIELYVFDWILIKTLKIIFKL